MTWFKVDDRFHSHPKALTPSLAALGLWAVAGSWSSAHLTDGVLPDQVVSLLSRGASELAQELVAAGLWRRTRGGYRFHNFNQYNPTAEQEADKRRKRSEAGRKGGLNSGKSRSTREANASASAQAKRSKGNPEPVPDPVVASDEATHTHGKSIGFDAFWDAYPRKDNKDAARKAWDKAVKKVPVDALISEIRRWRGLWETAGVERRFIPHASTWLNGQRWTDEPPVPRLRAVSGDYRPWSNPADPSVYDQELL